jgi:hypothetical protein
MLFLLVPAGTYYFSKILTDTAVSEVGIHIDQNAILYILIVT